MPHPSPAACRVASGRPPGVVVWPWPDLDAERTVEELRAVLGPDASIRVGAVAPPRDTPGALLKDVAQATPGADLLLLSAPSHVDAASLGALGGAAASADDVLAACARRDADRGRGAPAATVAATVADPGDVRIVAPRPGMVWLRRAAWELLGGCDTELTHPEAVLLDLAARGLAQGLTTVLTSTARTMGGDPAADGPGSCPREVREALLDRHPLLHAALAEEAGLDPGPERRVWLAGRVRQRGLSVTIDARSLSLGVGGTQTYVGSLTRALAGSGRVRVRAVLGAAPPRELAAHWSELGVETVSYDQVIAGTPRTVLVHRPQQVFTPEDLSLLRLLGDRTVVSHLDLIAYRAPGYHATPERWRAYRRTTRLALAAADGVLCLSEHTRRELLVEELVPRSRTAVAGIGVDPQGPQVAPQRPAGLPEGRDLLVMAGSDYRHKNRRFALELVDALRVRHGWAGLLVFAGPHVDHGSSALAEAELLAERPRLRDAVIDLGVVCAAERAWLFDAAVAHLYPSSYEGFGLGPLEAGAVDRPCIYAAWTAMRETIDPAAATIVPWDPEASADAAIRLLRSPDARQRHLELLRDAVDRHRWSSVVENVLDAYEQAIASPFRAAAPRAFAELEREQHIVKLDASLRDLSSRVSTGLALIDTARPLLSVAEQRGLIRLSHHRRLRRLPLRVLRALGERRASS